MANRKFIMSDLLLEFFCEEIPANMQAPAAEHLKKSVTNALVEHGLNYVAAVTYWTPRRICLDLRGLSESSAAKLVEKKGPSVAAPESAKLGFVRSAGLKDISEATIVSIPTKGDFYFASYMQPGLSAAQIIAQIMPNIIARFSWPKSMRWGADSAHSQAMRWVRPLQNILCILSNELNGTEIIPFEAGGLIANNYTYGHRFLAGTEAIRVKNFSDYQSKLERAYVVLDAERRKNIIKSDAANLCFANRLALVEDDALLAEVANLVEFPVVLMGQFDQQFMALPQKLIQTTIRENQKCFVTTKIDDSTNLSNRFIMCANVETADGGALIIQGNEKVVRARLSDAMHFFHKDSQPSLALPRLTSAPELLPLISALNLNLQKPLDQRMGIIAIEETIFYKNLGTQAQRVVRLAQLSNFIAPMLSIQDLSQVQRAASLAKADLASDMVPEFPSLQGYMGRQYALAQGESESVAAAIEEHYKPHGPSDMVPSSAISVALGLADRLDILVGFWLIDEKPTGSRDPFALRRAAMGVVRLVLTRNEYIPLQSILEYSQKLLLSQCKIASSGRDIVADLLAFIKERFKTHIQSEGARICVIDAVMVNKDDNLLGYARKIEALIVFLDKNSGKLFYKAIKRVSNILASIEAHDKALDNNLLHAEEEKQLFAAWQEALTKINLALVKQDYMTAFESLALLSLPIENFFDNLLVEDNRVEVKANRVALLQSILKTSQYLADFSKII